MLYHILSNRDAVNGLNALAAHSGAVKLDTLSLAEETALILAEHDLIFYDENMVTISVKGKQFLLLLDELKGILHGTKKGAVRMTFSLRPEEQDVLLLLAQRGNMNPETLFELVKEKGILKTKKDFDRILKALEDIQLVQSGETIDITLLGKKTMTHFLLDEFNLHLF